MWISVRETIIEEKEVTLKDQKCPSGKVLLRLIRRDVRASFFLLPKKVVEVICLDTNKKVKKSHWSPEIKGKARAMKTNLKVPTWGYWSIGIALVIVFLGVPFGFYMEVKDTIRNKHQFMNQNALQQKETLKTLDVGDLIATMNKVYRISAIDENTVILTESSTPAKPENYIDGLTTEDYPGASFDGNEISVLKSMFLSSRISPQDLILAVLDN